MRRYTDAERSLLKRAIKRSLFPLDGQAIREIPEGCSETEIHIWRPERITDGEGNMRWHFIRKVAGSTAFALAKKDGLHKQGLIRLRRLCIEGWSRGQVADFEGITVHAVEVSIDRVLWAIVENLPFGLAEAILNPKPPRWRIKACPRCGGDQEQIKPGSYFSEAVWHCLQCGTEVDIDSREICPALNKGL